PGVDETVVARRALQVRAEEDLRYVLRELQLDDLTGVDLATPPDPLREPLRVRSRADQLADESVVRLVLQQRPVQPRRDLLPPAVNVTRATILVTQHVVP